VAEIQQFARSQHPHWVTSGDDLINHFIEQPTDSGPVFHTLSCFIQTHWPYSTPYTLNIP
jgi:hypothetical protein